jgi:HSP20 family protein
MDLVRAFAYLIILRLRSAMCRGGVELTVDNGVLTIKAERREERKESGRSEFRYGAFTRSVTLPAGADEDAVTALYNDGILEVRVPIKEAKGPETKRITIDKR